MGGGWVGGPNQEIIPLRGSILQADTCQILSLAENPRWSPSMAKIFRSKNSWTQVILVPSIYISIFQSVNNHIMIFQHKHHYTKCSPEPAWVFLRGPQLIVAYKRRLNWAPGQNWKSSLISIPPCGWSSTRFLSSGRWYLVISCHINNNGEVWSIKYKSYKVLREQKVSLLGYCHNLTSFCLILV